MAKIPTSYALGEPDVSAGRNVVAFDRQDRINLEEPGKNIVALGKAVGTAGPQVFGALQAARDEADDYEITKELISFQREAERELDTSKHNMKPGGEGFADGFRQSYDDIARSTFKRFQDQGYGARSLKKLDQRMLEWSERFHTKAWHYELEERDRFHKADVEDQIIKKEADVEMNPWRVQDHVAATRQLIESSRLPLARRSEYLRKVPERLEEIAARKLIEQDPERAIEVIRKVRRLGSGDPSGNESTIDFIKRQEGDKDAGWDVRQYSGPYGVRRGENERLTLEQADGRLRQEVAPIEAWIDKTIKAPLSPEQRTAIVSLFYNIGMDKGRPEQLAKLLNEGQAEKVPGWIRQFTNDRDGNRLAGLVSRRDREAQLFASGFDRGLTGSVTRRTPATATEDGDREPEIKIEQSNNALFQHLRFWTQQKLLNVARVAMRNKIATEIDNDLKLIADGREPVRGPDGRTAIDRAGAILTKNQMAKVTERVEEAKLEAEIVRPLRDMSDEQAATHIERFRSDAGEESESYRRSTRVVEKAERAWRRITEERKRDLARSVERTPEVQEARRAIEQSRRTRAENGEVEPGNLSRDDRVALIEARIKAQTRIGVLEHERRIIDRAEASELLRIDPRTASDDQIDKALRGAAEEAVRRYGPHWEQAFKEAVAYRVPGDKTKDAVAGAVARATRNRGQILADDAKRIDAARAIDSQSLYGEDGAYTVRSPSESVPEPRRVPFGAPSGMRMPASGGPAGEAPQYPRPSAAQIEALRKDPMKWRPAFEHRFGAEQTIRALGGQ